MNTNKQGRLPEEIRTYLIKREWNNKSNLKNRLKGDRPFPLVVNLQPPTSSTILLQDTLHFQNFVQSWRQLPVVNSSFDVYWGTQNFRHFGEQDIPTKLVIHTINGLAEFLGESYVDELKYWQECLKIIFTVVPKNESVFRCLIDFLPEISSLTQDKLIQITQIIPQLKQGMGNNQYLRALPVIGIDTKFIETHFKLIENLLHIIHQNVLPEGLLNWLSCLEKPKDWLLVKPLCTKVQKDLGNLPIFRVNSETLLNTPLPAKYVLIIENEQSCLALPKIENAISVSGGGKNLNWLNAKWLKTKVVAYWGDIDSEGLIMLNQAREKLPNLTALMMNEQTLRQFQTRMVDEPTTVSQEPYYLNVMERTLFYQLQAKHFGKTRLEQERIDQDWISNSIYQWLTHLKD
ncbi:Wadjet anti-phage system protein JetD domain-containing protein [Ursidibacter arcticus]